MTKSDKKKQLQALITAFFNCSTSPELIIMRNNIYKILSQLPMSTNDRHIMEEDMYLWNYNSDKYIANIKKAGARATVENDFKVMLRAIDISLLGN